MKKFTEKELRTFLNEEIKKVIISEGLIDNITDFKNESPEEYEHIQLEDVKILAEEMKRMKELIDFKSPLLNKK